MHGQDRHRRFETVVLERQGVRRSLDRGGAALLPVGARILSASIRCEIKGKIADASIDAVPWRGLVLAEKRYRISVMTCAESGVLVGTSPDIPGLTLEADSREQLLAAVSDVVPQLLTHNLKMSEDQLAECVVEVVFTNPPVESMPDSTLAPSCPRIMVEHVDAAAAPS